MKFSWFLILLLLASVAIFSVQNAAPMTVRFFGWEAALSAALVIQIAALTGALVGLTVGGCSRLRRPGAEGARPSGAKDELTPTETGRR